MNLTAEEILKGQLKKTLFSDPTYISPEAYVYILKALDQYGQQCWMAARKNGSSWDELMEHKSYEIYCEQLKKKG